MQPFGGCDCGAVGDSGKAHPWNHHITKGDIAIIANIALHLGLTMELMLILGIILTATGILVGLYLPVLASHFATPEKIRVYAIAGAALVLIGTALEVFAVWPVVVEIEQQPEQSELMR